MKKATPKPSEITLKLCDKTTDQEYSKACAELVLKGLDTKSLAERAHDAFMQKKVKK